MPAQVFSSFRGSQCTRKSLTALSVIASVLLTGSAFAQTSGAIARGNDNASYYATGDATISGDLTGHPVFVGKRDLPSFDTLPGSHTLTITGSASGDGGSHLDRFKSSKHERIENAMLPSTLKDPATVSLFGNWIIDVQGGYVADIGLYDNSETRLESGRLSWAHLHGQSVLNVTGGGVHTVDVRDTASVHLTEKAAAADLYAYDKARIFLRDGAASTVICYGNSAFEMSGGKIVDAMARDSGTLYVSAGTVLGRIELYDEGTVNIAGVDLEKTYTGHHTSLQVGGGGYVASTTDYGEYDSFEVTGKWADSKATPFRIEVAVFSKDGSTDDIRSRINLVKAWTGKARPSGSE